MVSIYILDNTNPDVQNITTGDTLTDKFDYTITDSDGDISTTTLTITVHGTDDNVSIVIPDNDSGSGDEVVYESGLADGSHVIGQSSSVTSSFDFQSPDGIGTPKGKIIFNGNGTNVEFTEAQLQTASATHPLDVDTGEGTLHIIHYSWDSNTKFGTIEYTYDLNTKQTHPDANGNNDITDSITITVTDRDGSTATDTLDIRIVDDIPTAKDNEASVVEGNNTINGNAISDTNTNGEIDIAGADGVLLNTFTYNKIGGGVETLTFDSSHTRYIKNTPNGELTIDQDGSWKFTSLISVDHDDNSTGVGNEENDKYEGSFKYTLIDSDGDISNEAEVKIDVTDTIATMNPDGFRVDEDDLSGNGAGEEGSDTTKDPVTKTANLNIISGQDPVEDIKFDGNDIATFIANYTSGREILNYQLSNSDHTLLVYRGNDVSLASEYVFEVTINPDLINPQNSEYSFELKGILDHPTTTYATQNYLMLDIPISLIEKDDIIKATAPVEIRDDVSKAVAEPDDLINDPATYKTVVEDSNITISGSVIDNDTTGADGAKLFKYWYIDDQGNNKISTTFDTDIHTATGILHIKQDGTWTFRAYDKVDHNDPRFGDSTATDGSANNSTKGSFEYTLIDGDEDKTSPRVKQTIHVTDGADPTASDVSNAVDEDDIPNGGSDGSQSNEISGNFNIAGGTDPIESVIFTTTGTDTLQSNGIDIDYSWDSSTDTLTGTAGNNTIFIAEVTGTASNPSYKFTLLGAIDHPDAHGENSIELPLEYKATDWDGDATTAKLKITITDDIPHVGTPDNGEVYESGLSQGTNPGVDPIEINKTLSVGKDADYFDTTFTLDTKTSLENQGIKAEGKNLEYTITNHSIVAVIDKGLSSEKSIFTVDIIDPHSSSTTYNFKLQEAIDNNNNAPTNINFKFKIRDVDGDEANSSFNVKIHDDAGQGDETIYLDEDNLGYHFSVTSDKIQSLDSSDSDYGTVSLDSTHNEFVYKPNSNYSGKDHSTNMTDDYFTINYTTTDGTNHTVKIHITIDPVSDAPTLTVNSATINTNEDTHIKLGLNALILTDTTDQNGTDTGDWSERLGAISLSGIPNGAKLLDGSGNILKTSNGSNITILISDIDYVNGTTADFTMTKAEFEELWIDPVPQSGDNITLTIKSTSYEVDANGDIIDDHNGNPVAGTESTTQLVVDVQAVTDTPQISNVGNASGDEDIWIRVDDRYSVTKTVDTDGSENYKLTFTGTFSNGSRYYTSTSAIDPADIDNAQLGSAISGNNFTISVSNNGGLPQFPYIYIMTSNNDSTDVDNIEVKVEVTDSDSDSTGVINTESATTHFNMNVVPVANDIEITTDPSNGEEDTKIDLKLHLVNDDSISESIHDITINKIPNGARLFDKNGTEIYHNTSGALGSKTILIDPGTSDALDGIKIQPPAHSSEDFMLGVTTTTIDKDDNDPTITVNGTISQVDIAIEVTPITENDTSDSNNDNNIDITLNSNHNYATHSREDNWYQLDRSTLGEPDLFKPFASNEDDENSTNNIHGSEKTKIVFNNVTDGANNNPSAIANAQLSYIDSNNNTYTLSLNSDAEVALEYLDSVKIKAPNNYSGTLAIDMHVKAQDFDEDTNIASSISNSKISTLTINIDPDPDGTVVSIAQSKGDEDMGRESDGRITSGTNRSAKDGIVLHVSVKTLDKDGSEHLNVFFDKIPNEAAIYYDIDGDGIKEIIVKGGELTDYDHTGSAVIDNTLTTTQITDLPKNENGPIYIVTDNNNGTWKLLIENYTDTGISQRDQPILIPPHNSNIDINLDASGYAVDKAIFADGSTTTETNAMGSVYDIDIIIDGKADNVANNEIYQQDIIVTTDPNTLDLSVALDNNRVGKYSSVVEEDMGNTQVGAKFNLKDIYKRPDDINSYDNIKTNDTDQNPIDTVVTNPSISGDIASETLSITITHLDSDFDLHGATLVGGSGNSRVWVTTAADINTGNITLTTIEHYSGEVNFDIGYVTTEDDGDTMTSPIQNVSLLVTPEAEGTTSTLIAHTDVNEDALTHMTFSNSTTLPDTDEYISSLGIVQSGYTDSNNNVHKGIDGADFTIYIGNGANKKSIQDVEADPNDTRVIKVTENGVDFYKISDTSDWNNLYVLYDDDIGGKEDPNNITTTHQTTFGFKFDVADKTQADGNNNGVYNDLIDTESGFQNTADYTFVLSPVTDDITTKVNENAGDNDITSTTPTDITIDPNDRHKVIIKNSTTIKVKIHIDGVDSDGNGQLDSDKSEQIKHIRVEGVPDGIGVADGRYIGDVAGQPDSTIWLVDLKSADIIKMDGSSKTYDLKFIVDGNYINGKDDTDIKVKVINQEYDTNGVEQSTAQTGDFTLNFKRDTNFGGSTIDAPMDILDSNGATTDEDGYSIDPNFTGFK